MNTLFRITRNLNVTPTFRKGELFFLTKNCTDHSDLNYKPRYNPESEYFKVGCAFSIVRCGENKYSVSATGELLNPVSNEEWCTVSVINEELDEEYYIDGVVRVKDLRMARAEDF